MMAVNFVWDLRQVYCVGERGIQQNEKKLKRFLSAMLAMLYFSCIPSRNIPPNPQLPVSLPCISLMVLFLVLWEEKVVMHVGHGIQQNKRYTQRGSLFTTPGGTGAEEGRRILEVQTPPQTPCSIQHTSLCLSCFPNNPPHPSHTHAHTRSLTCAHTKCRGRCYRMLYCPFTSDELAW